MPPIDTLPAGVHDLGLSRAGHPPTRIHTQARVHLERQGEGFASTRIELATEGQVPGLSAADFQSQAESATPGRRRARPPDARLPGPGGRGRRAGGSP